MLSEPKNKDSKISKDGQQAKEWRQRYAATYALSLCLSLRNHIESGHSYGIFDVEPFAMGPVQFSGPQSD